MTEAITYFEKSVELNPRNVKADDLKDMGLLAQKIAPFGWHLQFHLDARNLTTLGPRLRKLPVQVVVDHLGHMPVETGVDHPGFQELLAMLKDGCAWVKLSSPNRFGDPRPPYPSVIPYAHALIEAAPDRCVWATDWPHSRFGGFMPNDGDLLDLLAVLLGDVLQVLGEVSGAHGCSLGWRLASTTFNGSRGC